MRISRESLFDRQIRQMLHPDLKSIPCDEPGGKAISPSIGFTTISSSFLCM
jgi:hypothetical protein